MAGFFLCVSRVTQHVWTFVLIMSRHVAYHFTASNLKFEHKKNDC